MFVDVKNAHLKPRCGEDEEEWVELPEDHRRYGKYAIFRRLCGMRRGAVGLGGRLRDKAGLGQVQKRQSAPLIFYHPGQTGEVIVHGGRLHVS